VASEIPLLIAGEAPRFMSRVAEIVNPPRPKPPKKPAGDDGDAPPTSTPSPSFRSDD
jgi:hypothetical protein